MELEARPLPSEGWRENMVEVLREMNSTASEACSNLKNDEVGDRQKYLKHDPW
jgi:hypothetical protein